MTLALSTILGMHPWLTVMCWLLAMGWAFQAISWARNSSLLPDLTRMPAGKIAEIAEGAPHLTVVVPACNEEKAIAATLASLLASEGLRLQIIAVDDRSTDSTGSLMDAAAAHFAARGSRHTLEVLHITELPAGWLGKPHALAAGAELARAEWLLFTDGDVHFAPRALALALAYAQAEQADHVVMMPDWTMKTFGERAMHGAMHALTSWTLRLWRVADPKARDFLGVGAFNLLRRTTYESLGGFAALRMEVLEDVRLGWKVKRAGFRQRVVLGPGLAAVRWSHGAWGVVRNLEKNLFSLCRFRVTAMLVACAGVVVQIALPLAGFVIGGPARAGCTVTWLALAAIYISSSRVTRVPPVYVLVYPFAWGLFLFAMVRSMTLALWRGGVMWRGTLYPLKELREHAGSSWR